MKQNYVQFATANGYPTHHDTMFQAQLLGSRGLEGRRQSSRSIKEQDDAFQVMQQKAKEGKEAYRQAILEGKVIDPDGEITIKSLRKIEYDYEMKKQNSKISCAESGIQTIERLGRMSHLESGKLKKGYQRAVDDYTNEIAIAKAKIEELNPNN